MSARFLKCLGAGSVLLAAVTPSQARPYPDIARTEPCVACAPWLVTDDVIAAPHGHRRAVGLAYAYRPYTRFDIEALRAFTRMP